MIEIAAPPPSRLAKTPRAVYQTLRNAIELYYDNQRARIAYDHRASDPTKTEKLGDDDKAFMAKLATDSSRFEKDVLKYAANKMKGHAVYEWLISQRGIADTFAVIFMGYIDIERTETPSGLWRLCGLAVINGQRDRPRKGEKLSYNPHLKSRCYLLGESFIKAGNTHWRAYYDDYKNRKKNQIVECMLCGGGGVFTPKKDDEVQPAYTHDVPPNPSSDDGTYGKERVDAAIAASPAEKPTGKKGKPKKCPRCDGTGKAPWGQSDKHVHVASMRYMVKMFLVELYRRWREYEGLPVRVPYSEEYHERMKLDRPPGGR